MTDADVRVESFSVRRAIAPPVRAVVRLEVKADALAEIDDSEPAGRRADEERRSKAVGPCENLGGGGDVADHERGKD